jgi:hypothetical protein
MTDETWSAPFRVSYSTIATDPGFDRDRRARCSGPIATVIVSDRPAIAIDHNDDQDGSRRRSPPIATPIAPDGDADRPGW